MRNLVNPQQIRLFDPFDSVLTPQARRRLLDRWPGGIPTCAAGVDAGRLTGMYR